jgi:hypothetical protein
VVLATLTLAGVWYGWLRLRSGSIWPVSLSHSAFNNVMEGVAGAAVATSPAAMAYTTTETGVVTLLIVLAVAVYLLTARAADFAVPGAASRAGHDDGSATSRAGARFSRRWIRRGRP